MNGHLSRTMPASIDRDQVRRLIAEEGAQLVEVLPAKEFGEEPGGSSSFRRQKEPGFASLDGCQGRGKVASGRRIDLLSRFGGSATRSFCP